MASTDSATMQAQICDKFPEESYKTENCFLAAKYFTQIITDLTSSGKINGFSEKNQNHLFHYSG